MFSTSSQRSHWTFAGQTDLDKLRKETNAAFVEKHVREEEDKKTCLSMPEERVVLRHYEYALKEFCSRFKPPMPSYVVGTSIAYMKRFYLHNSVMNYHPKEIMLTAVYLAAKVEEFNVSISQFVANLKGNREKITETILSFELLLMQRLHYHLTVHNPFRPLEGLLIDIKTNCPSVANPEKLRKSADDFIDKSLNTDACLLFAPSQISLAAVLSSGSKNGISLDDYVRNKILSSGSEETLTITVEQVKRIKFMVKSIEPLNREDVRRLERKLEKCRNQANNPSSEIYKAKMEEIWEDEENRQTAKRVKLAEEENKEEMELVGL